MATYAERLKINPLNVASLATVEHTVKAGKIYVETLWERLFRIVDAKNAVNLGHRLLEVYKSPHCRSRGSYEHLYNDALPFKKALNSTIHDKNVNGEDELTHNLHAIQTGLDLLLQINDASLHNTCSVRRSELLQLQAELLGLQGAFLHQSKDPHGLAGAFNRVVSYLSDFSKQNAERLEKVPVLATATLILSQSTLTKAAQQVAQEALHAFDTYFETSQQDMNACSQAAVTMQVHLIALQHLSGEDLKTLQQKAKGEIEKAERLVLEASFQERKKRLDNVRKILLQAHGTCQHVDSNWTEVFQDKLNALPVIDHRFETVMKNHHPLLPATIKELKALLPQEKSAEASTAQPGYLASAYHILSWVLGSASKSTQSTTPSGAAPELDDDGELVERFAQQVNVSTPQIESVSPQMVSVGTFCGILRLMLKSLDQGGIEDWSAFKSLVPEGRKHDLKGFVEDFAKTPPLQLTEEWIRACLEALTYKYKLIHTEADITTMMALDPKTRLKALVLSLYNVTVK